MIQYNIPLKTIQNQQIEQVKKQSGCNLFAFQIQLLNSSFIPYKTYSFDNIDDMNKVFNELSKYEKRAFIRKQAVIKL